MNIWEKHYYNKIKEYKAKTLEVVNDHISNEQAEIVDKLFPLLDKNKGKILNEKLIDNILNSIGLIKPMNEIEFNKIYIDDEKEYWGGI